MPRSLSYALSAVLCLGLISCDRSDKAVLRGDAAYAASTTARQQTADSVFSYLASIDQSMFRHAFSGGVDESFIQYVRTEQFDEDDFRLAFDERVLRHDRGKITLLEADSAGTFDFGYFDGFVSDSSDAVVSANLAQHIVPVDPAYMSARNREAYVYRALPDTLMWNRAARVVEVRAHPEHGDGQKIRGVRLYVERSTDRLLAMYLERRDAALWFREQSRFYMQARPSAGGRWLPYHTRFETLIRVPFRPSQRFRAVSTFFKEKRIMNQE